MITIIIIIIIRFKTKRINGVGGVQDGPLREDGRGPVALELADPVARTNAVSFQIE